MAAGAVQLSWRKRSSLARITAALHCAAAALCLALALYQGMVAYATLGSIGTLVSHEAGKVYAAMPIGNVLYMAVMLALHSVQALFALDHVSGRSEELVVASSRWRSRSTLAELAVFAAVGAMCTLLGAAVNAIHKANFERFLLAGITAGLCHYWDGGEWEQSAALDWLQFDYRCCGAYGRDDWTNSTMCIDDYQSGGANATQPSGLQESLLLATLSVPHSCCSISSSQCYVAEASPERSQSPPHYHNAMGCLAAVSGSWLDPVYMPAAYVLLLVLQIAAVLGTQYLQCGVRNARRLVKLYRRPVAPAWLLPFGFGGHAHREALIAEAKERNVQAQKELLEKRRERDAAAAAARPDKAGGQRATKRRKTLRLEHRVAEAERTLMAPVPPHMTDMGGLRTVRTAPPPTTTAATGPVGQSADRASATASGDSKGK